MKYIKISILLCLLFISQSFKALDYDYKTTYTNVVEHKIDSKHNKINKIIIAIVNYESSGNTNAVNHRENAVGILQIRPIMVKEVNRLSDIKFTLRDRYDSIKSVKMFKIYQKHFNPKWNFERACRLWNGGRSGMRKQATIKYYKKVVMKYKELCLNN